MQKVLDHINANIFVSDYESLEVLFANKPFREEAGQVPERVYYYNFVQISDIFF